MAFPIAAKPWQLRARAAWNQVQQRLLPPVLEPGAMPWFSLAYLLFLGFERYWPVAADYSTAPG